MKIFTKEELQAIVIELKHELADIFKSLNDGITIDEELQTRIEELNNSIKYYKRIKLEHYLRDGH